MRICPFALSFVATVSIGHLAALAQQPSLLQWKFQPGQAFTVELDQDVEMSTTAMENMRSSADMGMTLNWHVADVDSEGTANLEQAISRIRMKMSMPGGIQLQFDSADDAPEDPMARHMSASVAPLIGAQFTLEHSAQGSITDLKLTDASAKAIQANAPGVNAAETLSHEGLASLIRQASLELPAKPVQPGDAWDAKHEIDSPVGKLQSTTTYTYRGTESIDGRQLARIDVGISIQFGEEQNAMGLDVHVAEQDNSGTVYFDVERGQLVKSEVSQDMTLETQMGQNVHRQRMKTMLGMRVVENREIASVPVERK